MTPRNLTRNKLINIPRMCVRDNNIPCINKNIHVIDKLSEINLLNSQTQSLEEMLIFRMQFQKCFGFLLFDSLSVAIAKFPGLIHYMLN